jgi:hypothetical protein
MSTPDDWRKAYADQASADFSTFQMLQHDSGVQECHKLQLLQMACEKLCKAHLIRTGIAPATIQSSHAYIAGSLPVVLRQEIIARKAHVRSLRETMKAIRHIAQEIEVLSPSVDRNGQRPDNCEYPWEDLGGALHSPLFWRFEPTNLLVAPSGRHFLKLVRLAINRMQ